jgi:hypothetical protein
MQKAVAWGVSAMLAVGIVAAYYLWTLLATREPPIKSVETPQASAPPPAAEPAVRYPIERVPRPPEASPTAASPLPPLDASDAEMQDSLARLIGRSAFHELIRPESFIRHVVVTVDNLPRKTLAPRLTPVKPTPGPFLAPAGAARMTLAAANVSRYTPYVSALESIDAHKLAAAYAYYYPLFQQAYQELGYPNGYFNDRLIEAIDVLLATPDPKGPVVLVQPRVVYQFEDPDLEALPSGQKIMLRIGPENAARVKAKLKEIRRALTGQSVATVVRPPPPRVVPDALSAPSAPAPSSTTASGG